MSGAFGHPVPAERPRTPDVDYGVPAESAVACRPDADLGNALATAFDAKYAGYSPAATDWEDDGLHRIEPPVMLAWGDMPTATRWRFPGGG